MKIATLLYLGLSSVLLLTSCTTSDKNPLPLYLAPDSPLDEPGQSAARKKELLRRQKEGAFPIGATVTVSQGKSFFFAQNPEIDGMFGGKMMEADTVTIVTCEGMYYYVKTMDDDGGYLRESDLINPDVMAQANFDMSVMDGVVFGEPSAVSEVTGEGALFPASDGLTMELPANDPNATKVVTNAQGRVVTMVSKKTDASDRFEQTKAAIPFSTPVAAPKEQPQSPPAAAVDDSDIPDLP